MVQIARWYLLPCFLVTLFAYLTWYERLHARGFGFIRNAMGNAAEFVIARLLIAIFGIGALLFLEVFRKELPAWARQAYFLMVAAIIALFVVDWIVIKFGPEPVWHHP